MSQAQRTPRLTLAGLSVLLLASAFVSPQCRGWAVGWGQDFPTPVLTSDGELCELVEKQLDGEEVIISGKHDDFADHARWMIELLTEDPASMTAENMEMVEYLEDCLSEKPTPSATPPSGSRSTPPAETTE